MPTPASCLHSTSHRADNHSSRCCSVRRGTAKGRAQPVVVVRRVPAAGTMFGMNPDVVWGGGRLGSGVRIGVPAGMLFGLIQFALSGSAGRAISAGVLFGVLFGAAM